MRALRWQSEGMQFIDEPDELWVTDRDVLLTIIGLDGFAMGDEIVEMGESFTLVYTDVTTGEILRHLKARRADDPEVSSHGWKLVAWRRRQR